jgi:hypothetical protein
VCAKRCEIIHQGETCSALATTPGLRSSSISTSSSPSPSSVFLFFLPIAPSFHLLRFPQPVFQVNCNTYSVVALVILARISSFLHSPQHAPIPPFRPDNEPRNFPRSILTACYGVQSGYCYLPNPLPPCATDSYPSSIHQLVHHRLLHQLFRDAFSGFSIDFFLC